MTVTYPAGLLAEGRTLLDRLDDLAREFGVHATDQLSIRVDDLAQIEAVMSRLRTAPPTILGGLAVQSVDDLATGPHGLPPTDGLRFTLPGARVVVRPSGTEPKLKCYLEVVLPVGSVAELPSVRDRAATDLAAVADALRTALHF